MARKREAQKVIPCTRYTYQAWIKTYPQSNIEEWKEITRPENISFFIINEKDKYLEDHKLSKNEVDRMKLKVVTIDEEYFKWLEGRSDRPELLKNYINEVSEAKALKLLKKNNLDAITNLYFIPIYYLPKDFEKRYLEFSINTSTKRKIEQRLKAITKGDVEVSTTIIPALTLLQMSDEDIDFIYESMVDDRQDRIKPLGYTVYAGDMLPIVGYLPIKISFKVDTVILDEKKYTKPKEKHCIFPNNWSNFLGPNEELYEELEGADIDIVPFVVALDELGETYTQLIETLQMLLEQEIGSLNQEQQYTA